MIKALPFGPKSVWRYSRERGKLEIRHKDGGMRPIQRTYFDARPSGYHGAVDIPCASGTRFHAMRQGTIVRVGNEGAKKGFGRYARVTAKDGHDYLVAHLRSVKDEGTAVDLEDVYCRCNNTGNSFGSHAHIECWWRPGDRATRCDVYWQLVWLVEEQVMDLDDHVNPYARPRDPKETGHQLQYGDRGYEVMWVQWALGERRIDGVFDRALQRLVTRFQEDRFDQSTGKVGPKTWKALDAVVR